MEDWLAEDHLARFIVEAVERMDLSAFCSQYAGRGTRAYHPEMLLALLIYAYATGVFSSRRIEQATYDSVPFRYISANTHPDHDTLATFRRRFLNEFADIFLQVLELAQQMRLLKLGQVCVDGSKIHANASKHSALSYGHIDTQRARLQEEIKQIMALAEGADQTPLPEGLKLPEELKRRQERLATMDAAKAEIERRAQERYAREKADYDAKMKQRQDQEQSTGKKPRGKAPKAPDPTPRAEDQVNLTDSESRIMKSAGGGFEQSYNAQAAVDQESYLVVAAYVTQAANDKQQIEPMLEQLQSLPEPLGRVTHLVADAGYCSATNIAACETASIEPYIAVGKEAKTLGVLERFAAPEALPEGANTLQKMQHKLKTQAGRALYAVRKCTVEPVFGIIKSVMGFRQFSMRGLEKAEGEWRLVCLAWNLKRMAKMHPSCVQSG